MEIPTQGNIPLTLKKKREKMLRENQKNERKGGGE